VDLKNLNCIKFWKHSSLFCRTKSAIHSFLLSIKQWEVIHTCAQPRDHPSCFLSKRNSIFKRVARIWLFFYKRKIMLFKVWIRWRVMKKVKSEGSLSDAISPSLMIILGWWFFLSEKVIFLSNEDWCVIDVNRRIWNDPYCETCHKKQMT
jgi:hypothetical protein